MRRGAGAGAFGGAVALGGAQAQAPKSDHRLGGEPQAGEERARLSAEPEAQARSEIDALLDALAKASDPETASRAGAIRAPGVAFLG